MARSLRKFKETVEIKSLPLHRIRSHRYFPVAVVASFLLVAACIHVWQRVVVIGLVREVSLLQKESRCLVDDAHKLRTEIAALSMASRIEQYSIDSLGLQRVSLDRMVTLIPEESREAPADQLATMFSSMKRVAEYLPTFSEAKAAHRQLEPIRFESDEAGERGE
jgi:cell division protein FtsL